MPSFLVGSRVSFPSWSVPRAARAVLSTLLLLGAGCSNASAGVVAEALFQVSSAHPALIDRDRSQFNAREYEVFQKSQLAYFECHFVLSAAIRDPGIASLPILAGQSDPVQWLVDHLEVGFLEGSEILSIRLRSNDAHPEDLKRLVDAVANAYEKEVVYNGKQRQLLTRDAAARTAAGLRKDIATKMAEIEQLKEDMGPDGADSPEVRIKQIDLDILVDVYRQLRRCQETMDVVANAPERIRMIQAAVLRQE